MNLERLRQVAERYPILRSLLAPAAAARRYFSGYYQHERIAETLQLLLAEPPVMQVASFEGTFSMDARSDLFRIVLNSRDYEPRLARCSLDHLDPQRDAIDVGANVGLYSVLMARHLAEGRRVLAVEPTANALRHLHANIERNGVQGRVDVFEGVVTDHDGACEVQTIEGREEYSTIGRMMHPHVAGAPSTSVEVEAATLDTLVEGFSLDPGFIKVDVEGAEATVFKGASGVLANARPVVLSELSDFLLRKNGSSAAEVISLFQRHDYRVIDPLWPDHPVGSKSFGDILCIPQEHPRAGGR
jgi:FkbM family methyltransferase